MPTDWGEVSAYAAWTGVGVTLVGFGFVVKQLKYAADQSRQTARAMTSSLYSHVAIAMDRVNSRLLSDPDLIPYFHENVPLPAGDDLIRRRAELVCETILDMADSIVEQRRVRPDDMDWSTWYAYFRWLHEYGPALRTFLHDNVDFFPDYIFAGFGRIHVREPNRGTLTQVYCAHEFAAADEIGPTDVRSGDEAFLRKALGIGIDQAMPKPGYPWVRTWLFRLEEDEDRDVDPVIVADVHTSQKKGSDDHIATVKFIVTDERRVDTDSERAIRNWVLGTFDRTGVRKVHFVREPADPSASWVDKIDLKRHRQRLYGPQLFGGPAPVATRTRPWSRRPSKR